MLGKLPVWFQTAAMIVLCGVHVASIWWVLSQNDGGRSHHAAHWYIFQAMPIPIIYLGARLLWRLISGRNSDRRSIIIGWFGLAFVLPAVLALLFPPAVQMTRSAGVVSVGPLEERIAAVKVW